MEEKRSSEMTADFQRTTQRCIPEDRILRLVPLLHIRDIKTNYAPTDSIHTHFSSFLVNHSVIPTHAISVTESLLVNMY
jgi:hypothetical protein